MKRNSVQADDSPEQTMEQNTGHEDNKLMKKQGGDRGPVPGPGEEESRGKRFGFLMRAAGSRGKRYSFLLCAVVGLATGLANGLFGSGGGTIAVPAMVHLLKAEEHKAHATAISVILPLTVVSSIFYIIKGFADWGITFRVTLGGLVGGYIGAKLLNKCPDRLLRRIFAVFMAAAGIKMIF
jgi:uncharacterized membrane protein YfcA